jgi:ABC-type glycerol-3-phosphate transport system permease component
MIKILAFINGWNQRCHPFIWTKTPDDILAKIKRKQISSAHQ